MRRNPIPTAEPVWLDTQPGRRYRRRFTLERWRKALLIALSLFTPAVACIALGSAFGPAWSAHQGHGARGVWTATSKHCDKGCTWTGTFSVPGTPMPAMTLSVPGYGTTTLPAGFMGTYPPTDVQNNVGIDGASVHAAGQQIPAVDTGGDNTVFPVGGGDAWLKDAVFSTLGAFGVLLWAWFVPVRMIRRRRWLARQ